MVKSKLTFWNLLIPVLCVAIPILPFLLFLDKDNNFALENFKIPYVFVVVLLLLSWLLVIGIIRKRIIVLTITQTRISVKNYVGHHEEYNFKDFDGFETTLENSKSRTYEALFLMRDKKSIIHISQFHIENYFEIKEIIEANSTNLGFVKSNAFTSWKRFL
jgi:hypothetical protein